MADILLTSTSQKSAEMSLSEESLFGETEISMAAIQEQEDLAQMDTANQQTWHKKCFLVEMCRHRKIRKLTIIVYFTWFTVAMVYYGLALNSPEMTSDRYLGFFVAGAVEIPAYLLTFVAVQSVGRKRSYCSTFLVGGIACLCVYIVPKSVDWLRSTLAILGKFSVTATFAISYLYTAELFPTEIRTMAVGYGSVCARLGSISAPYILQLLGSYHEAIPLVMFGVLSIMSGLLTLLLPETENVNLPESISSFAEDRIPSEAQHLEDKILPTENEVEKSKGGT